MKLITPELLIVFKVRALMALILNPLPAEADTGPEALSVRGVFKRKVTPTSWEGSVIKSPLLIVVGWLVLVTDAS